MIGRNDLCWCGSQKKWKKCHFPSEPPKKEGFGDQRRKYFRLHKILLKDEKEIEGIRASCRLAAHILDETCKMAEAGVTTEELNAFAHQMHEDAGATPAPLHYGTPPFPKSICTSLNDVICHGIPDNLPLKEGDILNIDVTCILHGYYGDCSRMVAVGKASPEKQLVMDVAYECLQRGAAILKPGLPLFKIGEVMEEYAHAQGCSVVNQFVAHGVGLEFHEPPQIMHCKNRNRTPLAPGMTFTLEPMINAGVRDAVIDPHDKWTARTADGKPSAQWEYTLLVTESGYEVLTPWKY